MEYNKITIEKNVIKYSFIITSILMLIACKKGIKIEVKEIEASCNTSCFRGIKPDIYYKELVLVAGEPNEFIDIKHSADDEGDDHNPIYYYEEGKVMSYWSGKKSEKIGLVEYTPFNNKHIRIESFFKIPLDEYNITPDTKIVSVFKEDSLFFLIYLNNMEIKNIEYWLVKKEFLNIADAYD